MKWLIPALLSLGLSLQSAKAAEIWFSPDPSKASDYTALFEPNAPWQHAAMAVKVLKTNTQWILSAPDAVLKQMFADLDRRGIALGVEGLMTPRTNASCGLGVEGYSAPGSMKLLAERIKRLGGNLQYIAMDEPITYAHLYNGPNACHRPIVDLANDIAVNVAAIRAVFPLAKIGDIEVITTPLDKINQFAAAYQAATGSKLDFFHADMDWGNPSSAMGLPPLITQMHNLGINVGVIYNGNGDDPTDVAWTQSAEHRFTAIEADPTLIADHVILQTWMTHPTHVLPENLPGTMTYLVNRYSAAQTTLSLQVTGANLSGTLLKGGVPVSGANILINAIDSSAGGTNVTQNITGTVPAGATTAIWGIRINVECSCSGPANVTVGSMQYRDTKQTASRAFTPTHYVLQSTETYMRNTPAFPVTASAAFTLSVPMQVTYPSRNSGYVTLVWLNANGAEISRLKIPFQPATLTLGTAITDSMGVFSIVSPFSSAIFSAQYTGGMEWNRASSATTP